MRSSSQPESRIPERWPFELNCIAVHQRPAGDFGPDDLSIAGNDLAVPKAGFPPRSQFSKKNSGLEGLQLDRDVQARKNRVCKSAA